VTTTNIVGSTSLPKAGGIENIISSNYVCGLVSFELYTVMMMITYVDIYIYTEELIFKININCSFIPFPYISLMNYYSTFNSLYSNILHIRNLNKNNINNVTLNKT